MNALMLNEINYNIEYVMTLYFGDLVPSLSVSEADSYWRFMGYVETIFPHVLQENI